eukprot:scaffold7366_cov254-Pinguiococcus_pyrenoidosus.AAC.6
MGQEAVEQLVVLHKAHGQDALLQRGDEADHADACARRTGLFLARAGQLKDQSGRVRNFRRGPKAPNRRHRQHKNGGNPQASILL